MQDNLVVCKLLPDPEALEVSLTNNHINNSLINGVNSPSIHWYFFVTLVNTVVKKLYDHETKSLVSCDQKNQEYLFLNCLSFLANLGILGKNKSFQIN